MSARLPWLFDDGGRAESGRRGQAGDCVARSIAIATGRTYDEVYAALADVNARRRGSRGRRTAREGIRTDTRAFREYAAGLGLVWRPLMSIGSGCTVHLAAGEVPATGRFVLSLSRHYTALIDGTVRDIFDPQSATIISENGVRRIAGLCVYGYWELQS